MRLLVFSEEVVTDPGARSNLQGVRFSLVVILLVGLMPSKAAAFGLGLEGAVAVSNTTSNVYASNPGPTWFSAGGITAENVFAVSPLLFLDVWADLRTPSELMVGWGVPTTTGKYIPVDLGLRFGLGYRTINPYVGVLGQVAFLSDGNHDPFLRTPIWGAGGDLGFDILVGPLRLGVEVRVIQSMSAIASPLVALAGSDSLRPVDDGAALEIDAIWSTRVVF